MSELEKTSIYYVKYDIYCRRRAVQASPEMVVEQVEKSAQVWILHLTVNEHMTVNRDVRLMIMMNVKDWENQSKLELIQMT